MERTVLITGAGSDIGLAAVLEASRLGFPVVAAVPCPTMTAGIHDAAEREGLTVRTEVLDVAGGAAPGGELIDRTTPWALVNCTELPAAGALEDVPVAEAQRLFEALVFAPIRLAQRALPHMRRAGAGRIVNVSPVAAGGPVPLLGWNHTIRTTLLAVSEALREEVAGDGIEVVVVEPGAVRTAAWDQVAAELRARRERSRQPERYDRGLDAVRRVVAEGEEPALVAAAIGTVLRTPRPPLRFRARSGPAVLPVVDRLRDRLSRTVDGL